MRAQKGNARHSPEDAYVLPRQFPTLAAVVKPVVAPRRMMRARVAGAKRKNREYLSLER